MERDGRIKKIAFWRIKEIYKNIVFFSNAFLGRKIRQKLIFYAKNTLKNAKNQTFFAKNIFGEKSLIFGGIFGGFQEVILCDQKISKAANVLR